MSEAMAQWWRRLRSAVGRVLRGHQGGQSLVIITFAFIGILAFVGLAIDLGWVYVARVRVAQAADAAALAGASELPLEAPAQLRALVYLQENGFDYSAPSIRGRTLNYVTRRTGSASGSGSRSS
jgi:Flp pilus assembly protein TadG